MSDDAIAIPCARCGHVAKLPRVFASVAGASFTCSKCGRVQDLGGKPSLPPDPMLARVAAALGATVSGPCAIVPTRPYDVQISIDFNSGTPMGLSLHARTRPLPDVTFTVESSLDRAGRSIGLTREVQLGDASFDPHVWVDADADADVVRGLLRAPETRRAIVAILHSGHRQENVIPASDVKLCEQGVLASVGLSALDDEPALKAIVEAVATIARTIEPPPATKVVPARMPLRVTLVWLVAIVVAVAAIPSCVAAETHPPLFAGVRAHVYGVLAGVVAWVLLLPILALTVRGRSSSLTTLMITGTLWLVVLGCLGGALAPMLNWTLDDSAAEEHRATVVSVEQLSGDDDSIWYRVTLRSWNDPSDTFQIARDDPGSLKPGKAMTVRTRRGRFGWEWLAETP